MQGLLEKLVHIPKKAHTGSAEAVLPQWHYWQHHPHYTTHPPTLMPSDLWNPSGVMWFNATLKPIAHQDNSVVIRGNRLMFIEWEEALSREWPAQVWKNYWKITVLFITATFPMVLSSKESTSLRGAVVLGQRELLKEIRWKVKTKNPKRHNSNQYFRRWGI